VSTADELKSRLQKHLKIEWDIVLNDNRSTMLRVLSRKRKSARVSIHRIFLEAPDEVISAVAHHVRGTRRNQDHLIRGYIQTSLPRLHYPVGETVTKGQHYDLQMIYDHINAAYFQNTLNLKITWYGSAAKKPRTRITYGQYLDHQKLVKIHRLLDDPFFPPYFVEFIVYHEMLHAIVPGYLDEAGYFRTHGAEFKEREQAFAHYKRAIAWEKRHKEKLFRGRT